MVIIFKFIQQVSIVFLEIHTNHSKTFKHRENPSLNHHLHQTHHHTYQLPPHTNHPPPHSQIAPTTPPPSPLTSKVPIQTHLIKRVHTFAGISKDECVNVVVGQIFRTVK